MPSASSAGATLGAIESASLAVALIGQGLALARGLVTKHAIKQVDRMLANQGIDVDALLHHWVPFVVGKRPSITVAMDWTGRENHKMMLDHYQQTKNMLVSYSPKALGFF